jgi:formylmethanofuran dehydrogenase subunit E
MRYRLSTIAYPYGKHGSSLPQHEYNALRREYERNVQEDWDTRLHDWELLENPAPRTDAASNLVRCEHCGEEFKPQRSTAKYCSRKCRRKFHKQRAKK